MKVLSIILFIILSLNGLAQDRKYSTFYEQRSSLFETLPITSQDIVFVGNSIINGGEWHEFFDDKHIKNRGISGDTSEGVFDRLESITRGKPDKIFLLIGINDIAKNTAVDTISNNIEKIILNIKEESPDTNIYLQSVLPVNPDFGMFSGHMKSDSIKHLNEQIEQLSQKYNVAYIDLYSQFVMDGSDKLSPSYTNDGLHLLGEGYIRWGEIIDSYIREDKMNKRIERLPDYPIQGGVSAPFAGISCNKLIVSGGCNFPDIPTLEGGKKEFYDDVFYLDTTHPNKRWIKAATMPYKVAYGASVVTEDGIICIGGQNDSGAIDRVVRIGFDEKTKKIKVENLPSLPVGLFNAGATIIEATIYVSGGVSSEKKSNYVYSLNLKDIPKGWQTINTNLKEERQQPAVFSQDGNLFMAGGYDEQNAKVFSDILKFGFEDNQWHKFSDIVIGEKQKTFIGSSCANISSSCTLFTGGVDFEIFSSALERIKRRQKAVSEGDDILAESLKKAGKKYMSQPAQWYKFDTNIVLFDTKRKGWKSLGNYPQSARAGAAIAIDGNDVYIICGEIKPGVRTAEINKLVLN